MLASYVQRVHEILATSCIYTSPCSFVMFGHIYMCSDIDTNSYTVITVI